MTTKSAIVSQVKVCPEKKTTDDKQYATISKESIQIYGESNETGDIHEDVAALIGEDVSYRLRQVIQVSSQYVRHSRRKKLTNDDINMALKSMDVHEVLGHASPSPLPFMKIKDCELYHSTGATVALSDVCHSKITPRHCQQSTVTGEWTVLDGVIQPPKSEPQIALVEPHLSYYTQITQAILSVDTELVKISLTDLRTNPNISPILPHIVSFISDGVKTLNEDANQLMKILYTVKSITSNNNLNLHPTPYITVLVDCVLYCLLDPITLTINPLNDYWVLRDYAANLLSSINRRLSTAMNEVEQQIVSRLHMTLQDLTKPYCCHYGAIMALISLGHRYIEEIVVAELSCYWSHLDLTLNDPSCANTQVMADALKVHGALLLAVDKLLQLKIKTFKEQKTTRDKAMDNDTDDLTETVTLDNITEFYTEMHEYFGDALSLRLNELKGNDRFQAKPRDDCVNLGDKDTSKSGEELLEEFMKHGEGQTSTGVEQANLWTDVRPESETRLRQARFKFASQRSVFVGKRQFKNENSHDNSLYGGSSKKSRLQGYKLAGSRSSQGSRLQEEWCDEVKEHGGVVGRFGEDESSRSSEGSESVQSFKSHEMSIESDASDPSKIKFKMSQLPARHSPAVSDISAQSKQSRKSDETSLGGSDTDVKIEFDAHDYMPDTKPYTPQYQDISPKHEPQSPKSDTMA